MTQKKAIEESLRMLGGRAPLQKIYPLAIEIGDFSGSKNPKATIRNYLQTSPMSFRHSPGMPDGWYELISFQEEIACRDNCIAKLKERIAEMEEEIAKWEKVPKEDDFVKKFVKETKHFFKHDRKKADVVRQIMIKVGRPDADKELDSWIDGKEQPSTAQAIQMQTEALLNLAERSTIPNIHGDMIIGDKIAEKIVIPSVGNYKPHITTQNIEAPMPSLGQQQEPQQLENE